MPRGARRGRGTMHDSESRLEQLFNRASEMADPEAQAAFLDQACAHDPILRNQIERLLRAHERAGHFLNGGPAPVEPGQGGLPGLPDEGEAPGRIGDYRLTGLIGEGGFSRVYLAEQDRPVRRWVALKIIKPGMDTREVILRFQRERQALALMDHPAIAHVYDAGATPGGRPYFVMEWVRGVEVTRYCDEHQLSIPARLDLFRQICLAVMHAHQKGIIHRDLKPSNILVSEQDGVPCPKIIDFGIAKVTHGLSTDPTPVTCGTSFMGTPAYMSPEQARLGNPDVDTRSDIYSLGAVLYELLTGHPPFDNQALLGATWEAMATVIRSHDPPRPSVRLKRLTAEELRVTATSRQSTPYAFCRMLQGDLDWITLKALEKERERRYQSAGNLAEDVRHYLEHQPVSAAAPTLRYRMTKLARRHRTAVAVSSLILFLLILSVAVSSRLALKASRNASLARDSQTSAERAERDARRRLIEVNVAAALTANDHRDYDHAMLWFAHAAEAADRYPEEHRINLIRARSWLWWAALPVAAFEAPSRLKVLEFDPDTRLLLALTASHECTVCDIRTGLHAPWLKEVGPVEAAVWSPDGSRLALASVQGPVEIRQAADGELIERLSPPQPASALAFSPDGRFVGVGSREMAIWDQESHRWTGGWAHPGLITEILFARDGRRVATACTDGVARVFEIAAGGEPGGPVGEGFSHRCSIRVETCDNKTSYHESFLAEAYATALAFLDEGRQLATRSDLYEITIWNIRSGRALQRYDHICCSCNFRLDRDGRTMACGMHGNVVGVWDTRPGRPPALLPQGGCVFDVAFHPAGNLILAAGADHCGTFWAKDTGERVGPQLHHFTDVLNVAFSASGRLVATAQADGLVRVWTVPSQSHPGRVLAYASGPKRVRLDPARRWVVASADPGSNATLQQTRVYEVATGEPASPVIEFPATIQDAALSVQGSHLAVITRAPTNGGGFALAVHEVSTGTRVRSWEGLPSAPLALRWHPVQRDVAVICQGGEVGIADAEAGGPVTWLRGVEPAGPRSRPVRAAVSFTPSGGHLVSLGPGGTVEVWPTPAGVPSPTAPTRFGTNIWTFALSQDGRHAVTTTTSGDALVWDVGTSQPAGPILTHPGWVYRAQFSPDGPWLVTACHDGHARVWDWQHGAVIWKSLEHAEQVLDATFTPDGKWVLTACRDGAVRVWDPRSGELMMPAIRVGAQALRVLVTGDGRHAVIGSYGDGVHVLSLELLDPPPTPAVEDLRGLAELLSSAEIRDGKRHGLTAGEWLRRFQSIRKSEFGCLQTVLPGGAATAFADDGSAPSPCGAGADCAHCPASPSAGSRAVASPAGRR